MLEGGGFHFSSLLYRADVVSGKCRFGFFFWRGSFSTASFASFPIVVYDFRMMPSHLDNLWNAIERKMNEKNPSSLEEMIRIICREEIEKALFKIGEEVEREDESHVVK